MFAFNSRAGQFKFFSEGIAGSVVGIKFSIFYYTIWVFTSIPEELTGLKVGIFQMAISAWKSWQIQKITPLLYEKLLKFEGKKWSYFSHFHTLTWWNKHLKFHFRGYFTKSSFWHLKGEARAKIFAVQIAWLGSVNLAILCHSGTSNGFGAVRGVLVRGRPP